MSGFVDFGIATGLDTVLIRRPRAIDIVVPDCAIEEVHHDRLAITEHPVEKGADITDHVFKEPAECTLHYGWSNSSPANFLGSETYDQDVYAALLALQESGIPFDLFTGKRIYNDMLIAEITVSTDSTSEFALIAHIHCQQIIIVDTEQAALPSSDPASQAAPQKTAAIAQSGPQVVAPVTSPPAAVAQVIGT